LRGVIAYYALALFAKTFHFDRPAGGSGQRRISAPFDLSKLLWKPASQNRLPVMSLENTLADSVSTTRRLRAAPADGEHIGS
jgi:hypothetical protein